MQHKIISEYYSADLTKKSIVGLHDKNYFIEFYEHEELITREYFLDKSVFELETIAEDYVIEGKTWQLNKLFCQTYYSTKNSEEK